MDKKRWASFTMALKKPLAVPSRHWSECDMAKMEAKKLKSTFNKEVVCFDCHSVENKETCDWKEKLVLQPTKKNQSEQTKEQQITKNLKNRST